MRKPDINRADVYWAENHCWFNDAHYMRSTGTFKVVVIDPKSTMGIRYFEINAELEAWAKEHA